MDKKLSGLHEMLCDELIKRLKGDEPLSASELNVIRQFLKDNNIDSIPNGDNPLSHVLESLPEKFFGKEAN